MLMRLWSRFKELTGHVGRKGGAFLCFGVIFVVIGSAGFGGPPPSDLALENMAVLLAMLPLWAWYLSWILAGSLCIIGAFWKRFEPYGAALASSLPFAFAMGYFSASILGFGYRAWSGGLVWSIVAILIWIISGWPDKHNPKIE